TARRGDDRGGHPARPLARDLHAARRPDDARNGEAAPRRARPPGRAPRGGHLARRDDDPGDPGARAPGRARRVPERDPGGDGTVAGARRRPRVVPDVELEIVDDAALATEAAAGWITEAVDAGGHIGLSGGSGPRPAYERAGILRPDWGRV